MENLEQNVIFKSQRGSPKAHQGDLCVRPRLFQCYDIGGRSMVPTH